MTKVPGKNKGEAMLKEIKADFPLLILVNLILTPILRGKHTYHHKRKGQQRAILLSNLLSH